MHIHDILMTLLQRKLADGLEEGLPLDVADRTAHFDEHYIKGVAPSPASRMRRLISSVICGITCTVLPR